MKSVPQPPFITVMVPVRNEERFIAPTLVQLLEQRYPADRFEVLVADGGSTDATPEIVANLQHCYDNLRLLSNPGRWSSAGRNVAIQEAQGELFVLIDGHCEIGNPNYLREVADAFERSNADCLGRPQPLDVSGATPLQQAIAAARSSRLGHHPASFIYSQREGFVPPQSVAVAYRREVFKVVGLFDERFDACEDVEFNHRVAQAGFSCFFTPQVKVHYYPRSSLTGLARQLVRYGRGRVRLFCKHADTFSWGVALPAAFVAGVAVGPLLAQLWPLLGTCYLGVLGLYAAVVLSFSLALSLRQRRWSWLVFLPLIYVLIHVAAGVGVWWELLRGPSGPVSRDAEPRSGAAERVRPPTRSAAPRVAALPEAPRRG